MNFTESFLRLAIAGVLGAIIGYERERHSQPAGLRTHMIVCLAAALITIISTEMGNKFGADPSRIAAQIVSGIGFLGAGAIIKYGASIRGLTTAASLWGVSGIGMAVGIKLYQPAFAATILVFLSLWLIDALAKVVFPGKEIKTIHLYLETTAEGVIGKVEGILRKKGIEIKSIGVKEEIRENKTRLTIQARISDDINIDELTNKVSQLPEMLQFEIE